MDVAPGQGERVMGGRVRAAALALVVGASLGLVAAGPVHAAPGKPKPSISKVKPATGPATGGTVVKLKGVHLSTTKKVLFGGVKGTSLKVKNDRKLTVTAPAHAAGTVDVVVKTKLGKATKKAAFTYTAISTPTRAPSITALSPASGSAAGGTTVTLSGADLTGASAVTFGGTPGTGLAVASSTSLTVRTPAHLAGAVPVVVTTPAGSSAATTYTYLGVSTGTPVGPGLTAIQAPLPTGAPSQSLVSVRAVSCPAPGTCTAVGGFASADIQGPLVEQLANGSWTPTRPDEPVNYSGSSAPGLYAVDCPTTTFCAAVGDYDQGVAPFARSRPLLETWNGTTWSVATVTLPADAAPLQLAHLAAVDCTSAGSCVAVGYYRDSAANAHPVLITLDAGTWTLRTVTTPENPTAAQLNDVACSTTCVVVGQQTLMGHVVPFVVTGPGPIWDGNSVPLPGTPAVGQNAPLNAISCVSATSCVAVGQYVDMVPAGAVRGFVARYNGSTWQADIVSLPTAGASPANADNPAVVMTDVDCGAAGYCGATGTYRSVASANVPLLVSITPFGTTGTAVSTPGGDASPAGQLHNVACPASGSCAGVGTYLSGGVRVGLLAKLSGSVQPGATAPVPAGGSAPTFLGLDFDSATSGVGVGSYTDNGTRGLLVTGIPITPAAPV